MIRLANQKGRAKILFENYPDIETAYNLNQKLRQVYEIKKGKDITRTKLALWYQQVEKSGFKSFNTIMNTISANYQSILNYFENRSTNASAESFNAKIKAYRAQFNPQHLRMIPNYRLQIANYTKCFKKK